MAGAFFTFPMNYFAAASFRIEVIPRAELGKGRLARSRGEAVQRSRRTWYFF